MIRHEDDGDAMPGQDSFIDVICNMVGILIVLVMVVGARASRSRTNHVDDPPTAVDAASMPPRDLHKLEHEVEQATKAALTAEDEAGQKFASALGLRRQSELIEAQRAELAEVRTVMEQELQRRRSKLDAAQQHQFDIQRRIDAAQIRLTALTDERLALIKTPEQVEKVECVPTPIARRAGDSAVYVRIKYGELALVPVDELTAEARTKLDHLRSALQSRGEANDTFGPVDGFRLRVVLEYSEVETPGGGGPGTIAPRGEPDTLAFFTPVNDRMGLPIDQALLPTSPLMRKIRSMRADCPTVIAWVYPDSYSALNSLKKALWDEGVALSTWPRQKDEHILITTRGQRAMSQ